MVHAALQIQRLNVWKRINVPNNFQKKKDATVFNENDFVYYKRRTQPMGHVIKIGISLSNCHVVPYNKELLL